MAARGDHPPVRCSRKLVLVGAGHAHAQVLLTLIEQPVAGLEIVLVSPCSKAPYSGMVPAWLAGEYDWEACCIDFNSLCQRAGARLVMQNVTGIDLHGKQALLENGVRVGYDWLSINIGSTLHLPFTESSTGDIAQIVPMRPLTALCAHWQDVIDTVTRLLPGDRCRVLIVGGGAAGIESILSAHYRLNQLSPGIDFQFTLATQGQVLVPGLSARAGRILRVALRHRDIAVRTGFLAHRIDAGAVISKDGESIPADVILWATGAQAFSWPRESGLAADERGFIRIDAMLRSVSHPEVFAAGDCAAWNKPLPKAGVYAVRMAPVLAHNLRAVIEGNALQLYRPQRRYLVLVGTGDPNAVASWGRLGWQGAWVHAWKKKIDRRFLARYNATAVDADHTIIPIDKEGNS